MMNFLLAILIFIILGLIQGVPSEKAVIGDVVPDSPAEEAQFESNDEIIEIEGKSISTWEEFTSIVQKSPDEELEMVIARDDETKTLHVTPELGEIEDTEIGQIGVYQGFEKSFLKTFKFGFTQTYETTKLIITNLVMLINGQYSIDMLAGPVGIYDVTDQVVQTGFMNFLMWTAMLSINLGIINLVPLPALDGGRLLFVGIE